jgi:hypothetical protein
MNSHSFTHNQEYFRNSQVTNVQISSHLNLFIVIFYFLIFLIAQKVPIHETVLSIE